MSTGDLGFINQRGHLVVCGRADDMIINGGENIFPREAEEALGKLPGVADCFVRGDKSDPVSQRLVAYVVRSDDADGAAVTEDSVRHWIASELMEPAAPRDVYFLADLPRNDTGKVAVRRLPDVAEAAAGEPTNASAQPGAAPEGSHTRAA